MATATRGGRVRIRGGGDVFRVIGFGGGNAYLVLDREPWTTCETRAENVEAVPDGADVGIQAGPLPPDGPAGGGFGEDRDDLELLGGVELAGQAGPVPGLAHVVFAELVGRLPAQHRTAGVLRTCAKDALEAADVFDGVLQERAGLRIGLAVAPGTRRVEAAALRQARELVAAHAGGRAVGLLEVFRVLEALLAFADGR